MRKQTTTLDEEYASFRRRLKKTYPGIHFSLNFTKEFDDVRMSHVVTLSKLIAIRDCQILEYIKLDSDNFSFPKIQAYMSKTPVSIGLPHTWLFSDVLQLDIYIKQIQKDLKVKKEEDIKPKLEDIKPKLEIKREVKSEVKMESVPCIRVKQQKKVIYVDEIL